MKRIFATLFLVITTVTVSAQSANDNTLKFLGYPVDGSKSKMEAHLRSKGFTYDSYSDNYRGKFNGKQVNLYISTNNNNVDRIYVAFPPTSESNIRYEYNNLISQFNKNDKYTSLSANEKIAEKEDIYYEMSINNKRYEASYCYVPQIDTLALQQEIQEELIQRYTPDELEKLTEVDFMKFIFEKIEDILSGCVWFTIHKTYVGEYYIGLYYDNLNNRPNGEDL